MRAIHTQYWYWNQGRTYSVLESGPYILSTGTGIRAVHTQYWYRNQGRTYSVLVLESGPYILSTGR